MNPHLLDLKNNQLKIMRRIHELIRNAVKQLRGLLFLSGSWIDVTLLFVPYFPLITCGVTEWGWYTIIMFPLCISLGYWFFPERQRACSIKLFIMCALRYTWMSHKMPPVAQTILAALCVHVCAWTTHTAYSSMLYLIISLQWYWSVVFWSLGVDCSIWDK